MILPDLPAIVESSFKLLEVTVKGSSPHRRSPCLSLTPAVNTGMELTTHPGDLNAHKCIRHEMYMPRSWDFSRGAEKASVRIKGQVSTNSVIIARDLAIAGQGVALIPTYCLKGELASGSLQQVLSEWRLPSQTIRALYPHSRLQARKVKVFVDFMQKRFRTSL
jgi:DNA-binding transcriptional LysR family regulator